MKDLKVYKLADITPHKEAFVTVNEAGLVFPIYNSVPVFERKGKFLRLVKTIAEDTRFDSKVYTVILGNKQYAKFVKYADNQYIPVERVVVGAYSSADGEEETPDKQWKMLQDIKSNISRLKADKDLQKSTFVGSGLGLGAGLLLSSFAGSMKGLIMIGGTLAGAVIAYKIETKKQSKDGSSEKELPSSDTFTKKVEKLASSSDRVYSQSTIDNVKKMYKDADDTGKEMMSDMLDLLIASEQYKGEKRKAFLREGFGVLAENYGVKKVDDLRHSIKQKRVRFNKA